MLRLILLNSLVFGYLVIFAQPTRDQHPLSQILANTSVYVIEKNNTETIIKGSWYFDEDFRPGWILLKNSNDTTQGLYLRYNVYHNILEWRWSENEIKNLLVDRIESFSLLNDVYVSAQQFGKDQGFFKNIYTSDSFSICSKVSIKRKDIKAKPPFEEKDSIIFYETIDRYIYYNHKLHPINSSKELENLLSSWKMQSLKFKKSDLQDEAFLQSLGEQIEDHFN